jgi:hypothetical protein
MLSGRDRGAFAYAISDGTALKIGTSNDHPALRLAKLQTGNPRPLRLLAHTTAYRERVLHRVLHRERLRGEWFKITRRVLDIVRLWDWVDEALLAELDEWT